MFKLGFVLSVAVVPSSALFFLPRAQPQELVQEQEQVFKVRLQVANEREGIDDFLNDISDLFVVDTQSKAEEGANVAGGGCLMHLLASEDEYDPIDDRMLGRLFQGRMHDTNRFEGSEWQSPFGSVQPQKTEDSFAASMFTFFDGLMSSMLKDDTDSDAFNEPMANIPYFFSSDFLNAPQSSVYFSSMAVCKDEECAFQTRLSITSVRRSEGIPALVEPMLFMNLAEPSNADSNSELRDVSLAKDIVNDAFDKEQLGVKQVAEDWALEDDGEEDDSGGKKRHNKHAMILTEMLVIIPLIMASGVVYALWKWLVDRRQTQRDMDSLFSPALLDFHTTDHSTADAFTDIEAL